jgi:hypothetical protein
MEAGTIRPGRGIFLFARQYTSCHRNQEGGKCGLSVGPSSVQSSWIRCLRATEAAKDLT